jgi:hypothetical protein
MEPLQRVAFRLDGASYRLADALLRAAVAGEWTAIEADLRHGVACELRAEDEDPPVTDEEVAAALRAYRYDRDLISADEAQAWLSAWDLSAGEWRDAIVRRLLRERWSAASCAAPDDESLADAAWADLVCSGTLETLVARLAERLAVSGTGAAVPPSRSTEPVLPGWLGITETRDDPAVRRLELIEREYVARRAHDISAERVTAAIAAHAFEWTYVEATQLAFPVEAMAAEAALRVREDGESLADVARDLDRPVERWQGFLDAADGTLKPRLSAAAAGELQGPYHDDRGYVLLQVTARRAPHAGDAAVRAHAESRLWSAVAARALSRVQWEAPLVRAHG